MSISEMMADPMFPDCPPDADDAADNYVMDHMGPQQRASYEQHLAQCGRCRALVEQTRQFREALRRAFERERKE